MSNEVQAPTVLHIYMRDQGRFLSTRQAGNAAAKDFRRLARTQGDIILDFDGVEAATPPFLQELLDEASALISNNLDTGRIVLAAHLNDDLAETMRYVASHAKRGVAYVRGKKLYLLEERPQLAETLQEAQSLNPFFTAPQLAERLDINPDTATQRLKRLVALGAAERKLDPAAANRHIYRVADPASMESPSPQSKSPKPGARRRRVTSKA